MRERRAADGALEAFLLRVEATAPRILSRLFLNDRLSLAATLPVGGVHLPEAGLPADRIRRKFPQLRIGRSAHSLRSAREAAALGADFVILGPAFPTGAKRNPLASGVLRAAAREVGVPVWAIGGIATGNVATVVDSGVAGIVAIRSLRTPGAVRALRRAAATRR